MTETPTKKDIQDYPPGTVIITRPADPQKLEAYRKQLKTAKARNPNGKNWQPYKESRVRWKGKLV